MKKVVFLVLVFVAGTVLAELSISQTGFRKASLETVERCATEKNAEAQLELALRYYAGHQVSADAQKAFEWMSQAATLENQEAMRLLSQMYEEGIGVSVDLEKAESWSLAASACELSAEPETEGAKSCLAEVPLVPFPYVLQPIKELYPNSDVRQTIVSVQKNSTDYQTIAGDDALGLLVKYKRPKTSQAVGFSGIVLAGVELTDRKTGEQYWVLGEYLDDDPTYDYFCDSDLALFVDQELDSTVKITSWAVAYGHLLPDGKTVAVLDTREFKTDSLVELFERNRDSKVLANKICAKTLPQRGMGGSMTTVADEASAGSAASADDGVIMTIIKKVDDIISFLGKPFSLLSEDIADLAGGV